MTTVLTVLGTILIVLLKIILVLLLLVCFLLFCPVCYKAKTEFGEKFLASGRVCWLLGAVFITFSFQDGEMTSCIRLFGIDFGKVSAWRKKRKEKAAKKKAVKKQKSKAEGKQQSKKKASVKTSETEEILKSVTPIQEKKVSDKKAIKSDGANKDATKDNSYETEDTALKEKKKSKEGRRSIRSLWQRIKDFIQCIKGFFKSLASLRKKIKQKVDWGVDVKKFWKSENTQRMVCILKDNVLHLWRKLKPKVLRGSIIFGTGDPCSTGEILGVAAIFYAIYGRGIQVTPDFETARLEGNLFAKGRISLITIVIVLIRIFLSSEWSQFRREAEQLKEAF